MALFVDLVFLLKWKVINPMLFLVMIWNSNSHKFMLEEISFAFWSIAIWHCLYSLACCLFLWGPHIWRPNTFNYQTCPEFRSCQFLCCKFIKEKDRKIISCFLYKWNYIFLFQKLIKIDYAINSRICTLFMYNVQIFIWKHRDLSCVALHINSFAHFLMALINFSVIFLNANWS